MRLHIVTPQEGVQVEQLDVSSVTATGAFGELVLLPGHEALLASLAPGRLSYTEFGRTHHFYASGGFLQFVNDKVRILAESLVPVTQLDTIEVGLELERAIEALQSAEDRSPPNLKKLEAAVTAARAKLAVAKRRH